MTSQNTSKSGGAEASLVSLTDEELFTLVNELKSYQTLDVKQIANQAEIVFCDWHLCNDNLKKTTQPQKSIPSKKKGKAKDSDEEAEEYDDRGYVIRKDDTFIMKPEAIIAKNDKNKKSLQELEKVGEWFGI